MLSILTQFTLAAAVIVAAATLLTRAADRVAELTGLGRLLVGTVLLAALTSLPEVSVGVSAMTQGHADIAVGNMLGSSLMNLLILALLDMSVWSRGRMLSRISAAHALSGTMSIVLTALAALALQAKLGIAIGGVGIGSLAILVTWLLGVRLVYFDERFAAGQETAASPDAGTPPSTGRRAEGRRGAIARALLKCAASAAVILIASPHLSSAAARLADRTGIGDTFVGTTLVALTTSLPEAASTVAAVRMGRFDLAIGNVFGSNSLNMVILAPIDAASPDPLLTIAEPTHVLTALWAILVTAVAIIGQLYHVERRRKLLEPDALLMIVLILLALVSTYRS